MLRLQTAHRSGDWEAVVVDCAPTGETLRLLSFPDVARWWLEKVFPQQNRIMEAARPFARAVLDVSLPGEAVLDDVQRLVRNLIAMNEILRDNERVSLRLVMNPDRMVIDEARRTRPIRVTVPEAEESRGKRREKVAPPKRALSERAQSDPRETYGRISGQPRLRGGQLAANSRTSLGTKQRSRVLAWFDTASGRYLSLSRAGTDGREWVTVAPADPKTLRMRLGEMVSSVSTDTR